MVFVLGSLITAGRQESNNGNYRHHTDTKEPKTPNGEPFG
jgi:hypothetical protein